MVFWILISAIKELSRPISDVSIFTKFDCPRMPLEQEKYPHAYIIDPELPTFDD